MPSKQMTPDRRAQATANKRLNRQRRAAVFGVQEPGRVYVGGREVPLLVVDPMDYAHPASDVRVGA